MEKDIGTCPDCGNDNRNRWYIHPGRSYDVCIDIITLYSQDEDGSYGVWLGDKLKCDNCLRFIDNLYIGDCPKCPDIWRWSYKQTSHQGNIIVMYGENGGELVFSDDEIKNADSISCADCRNAVFELTRQT
jgi:hypothetical protein